MNATSTKILIVDDRPANLLAMRRLLHALPTRVIEADSGHKALELLLEHEFALMLLDVEMPGMDGYEVAEMARRFKHTRHVPIIFLTAAFKDRHHQLRGYAVGAVDYLEKPFEEPILLAKVQVFLDLFQLRQTQERTLLRLHQSETRFRTMVDNIGVGMVRADMQGVILEANVTFCALLGYTRQELTNCPISLISHPDDMARNLVQLQALRAGTLPSFHLEKRYFTKSGATVWGSVTVTLISGAGDEPDFFLAAIEDITRRKDQEEHLRRLSQAVEQSPVSIVITDVEGKIQYVNHRCTQVTGYTREELLGQNPRLFKSGMTTREEYQQLWRQITSGAEWRGEFFNKRKSGEHYWENVLITPMLDSAGRITGFMAVKEDISARKLTEKALHQSEMRFRMLAERAQDLIYHYRFDPPGFEFISPSVTRLTGYPPEAFYADPQMGTRLIHPEDHHLLERVEESFTQTLVLRWIRKDQTILWTEQRTTPTYDDQGKLISIDGILRDITQRHQAEVILAEAKMQAESAYQYSRSLIEASLDPLVTISAEGKITDVNTATELVTGVDRYLLIGSDFADYFTAPEQARRGYRQVFSQGSVTDYPLAIR
ncbi:MAG: PAS domain S-box protein, partial [Magnetococcales bacterium]|nr:PAS domain S-box protein [Magnetococcales bacterium]